MLHVYMPRWKEVTAFLQQRANFFSSTIQLPEVIPVLRKT